MSTKAAIRAQSLEAQVARLLDQCEHAGWFRFEVPGAPSITIHVEPDGMDRWAVTRFGWEEVKALTPAGWGRVTEFTDEQRFIWSISEALDAVPGLLEALAQDHAEWQRRRRDAERAASLAQVVEETLEPYRAYRETVEATAVEVSA